MTGWIKQMKNRFVAFCRRNESTITAVIIVTAVGGTGVAICKHVDETVFNHGKYVISELGEGTDLEEVSEK